ncbi:sensor histidine kinase [Paenibacillus monticola]|uniref:histidine kinase n=1 Tax=Paenibacillus monticola TaxID=2666075 RepID=A0A7X2H1H6_9BACL|nr:HAMP domain-containing sensor histidine kinase [Paenibacillus monticola]MRN51839.1 HAMP domain-containing protein [Paenibacillus monticola]
MKLWQKMVLSIIIVFVLGMDIVAYVLINKSYALNKTTEYSAAQNEQFFIKKSLSQSIASTAGNYTALNLDNLKSNIIPYADYYRNQKVYLELYINNEIVYSNFNNSMNSRPELNIGIGEQSRIAQDSGESRYLFIASYLAEPYSKLKFVYIKDVQGLMDYKKQITDYFVIISLVAALCLSCIIILLVWKLTRPLRALTKATGEIAKGHYQQRVQINSQDEIGEFARNFNIMAGSVETHVQLLSNATAEKQRFIDNLAHEMRTPITAIMGYGEFLKYANYSEEERIKALDYIISQSERMQNMSLKLLDLAGIRKDQICFGNIKLDEIVERVEATLAHRLTENKLEIKKILQHTVLWADAHLMESLLLNLLENAIRASSPGGSIDVLSYVKHEQFVLQISDHGQGMAEDEIQKVREPFYRVDKARSSQNGGAGLGLALCEQICLLHQATMNISSTLNIGTTVEIIFYNSMTTL